MTRVFAATFLLLACLCTPALASPVKPIVIDDSPGGIIQTFLDFYKAIKQSGVPVVLRGMCMSACTYIAILPRSQVCVEPTASLGFHLASDGDGNFDPGYTQAIAERYYPPVLLAWLSKIKLTPKVQFMSASEMVKIGLFPPCSPAELPE